MRVTALGRTDVGRRRTTNEDAFRVAPELGLFLVADGMGGHAGGERASHMAAETVLRVIREAREAAGGAFPADLPLERSPIPEHLRGAVQAACAEIYHAAHENPDLKGMGTTVSAVVLSPGQEPGGVDAFVAHVGDSRVYLVRGDHLQQISEDHSLVNEQIKAGVLTREEAKHSRFRNIITRSVGFEEDVLVDVMGFRAEPGDVLVLCSDGLSNYFEEEELLARVRDVPFPQLPDVLVEEANERGGEDNVTVVVVRVDAA